MFLQLSSIGVFKEHHRKRVDPKATAVVALLPEKRISCSLAAGQCLESNSTRLASSLLTEDTRPLFAFFNILHECAMSERLIEIAFALYAYLPKLQYPSNNCLNLDWLQINKQ